MPGTDGSFMKYEFLCGLVRPHLKPRKKGACQSIRHKPTQVKAHAENTKQHQKGSTTDNTLTDSVSSIHNTG
jgi:hypothetical protein